MTAAIKQIQIEESLQSQVDREETAAKNLEAATPGNTLVGAEHYLRQHNKLE